MAPPPRSSLAGSFPGSDPAAGTLLALATFGVGFVARPLGACFMGHIGDKSGRTRVLIFTLKMMGASTFLVGCLPTYNQIGTLAPIVLVLLRLCQGSQRRASGLAPTR